MIGRSKKLDRLLALGDSLVELYIHAKDHKEAVHYKEILGKLRNSIDREIDRLDKEEDHE